jgi:hypothetical protein
MKHPDHSIVSPVEDTDEAALGVAAGSPALDANCNAVPVHR